MAISPATVEGYGENAACWILNKLYNVPMAIRLTGKVIIITGASSGIGRATALALAREGAVLILVARREALLEEVRREVEAAGGKADCLALDLTRRDEVSRMIGETHLKFGRIDVLINNAGFGFFGTIEATPASVVDEIFALNFKEPLFAIQYVTPIMRGQGSGHIVNISSVIGRVMTPYFRERSGAKTPK